MENLEPKVENHEVSFEPKPIERSKKMHIPAKLKSRKLLTALGFVGALIAAQQYQLATLVICVYLVAQAYVDRR